MTVWAVDAPAGYGKTHRLMHMLSLTLIEHPLQEGQQVLALAFMHGARRRLNERLDSLQGLARRYACMTVDSLAWRVRQRWRSLGTHLGLPLPGDAGSYEAECKCAADMLADPALKRWLAGSFPIIVVDEAQDLTTPRLAIVAALSQVARVFLAADEFQCLNPELRPNPLEKWLPTVCKPETLPEPRRTNVQDLLGAAEAIRAGKPPESKKKFKIMAGPSLPLAAAQLASAIKWRNGGSVAVIAPTIRDKWVKGTIVHAQTKPSGKNKDAGPFPIRWEESESDEMVRLTDGLQLPDACSFAAAIEVLRALPRSGPVEQTIACLQRTASTTGRAETGKSEILDHVHRYVGIRRHQARSGDSGLLAMTVHQAKNREFDGVVLMWPYAIGGDEEAKRRLLYNAITRARRWCNVIVQGQDLMKKPPFG
ncbi:ATP-dependent helicase [Ramlibacter sp.]|uniref:ATP-dependent helicase n=1 Tax=Ramlibacter sp. TaxID=1917967 RepID=UPI002BD2F6B2|nr:ATP-dependent helicase [Ramlibacter sp.]HWI83848.1 ATP-dependent helicase [Ramlibacter sp.]